MHISHFSESGSPIFAKQSAAGPDGPHVKSLTHNNSRSSHTTY